MALDLKSLLKSQPSLEPHVLTLIEKLGNAAQQSLTQVEIQEQRVKELQGAMAKKKKVVGTGKQRLLSKDVAMTGQQLLDLMKNPPGTPTRSRAAKKAKTRVKFARVLRGQSDSDETSSDDEWSSNSSVYTEDDTIVLATPAQCRILDLRTPPPWTPRTPIPLDTPTPSVPPSPEPSSSSSVPSTAVGGRRTLRPRKK